MSLYILYDIYTERKEISLSNFHKSEKPRKVKPFQLKKFMFNIICKQSLCLHAPAGKHRSEKLCQCCTHLKRIDVMSDDDQLGLLLFYQFGDGVGSGFNETGLLLGLNILALSLGFSDLLQALLLGNGGFWAVFLQQLEHLDSGGLVKSLAELMDWWRNLQTLLQNSLLALDADVLGPFHKTGQVTFGLNVLACKRTMVVIVCAFQNLISYNLPIPKFLGRFSKSWFTTFLTTGFFTANGAGATFLVTGFFFGLG